MKKIITVSASGAILIIFILGFYSFAMAAVELVENINLQGGGIQYLTKVEDIIYFIADDGVHGIELWKSDGTDTGTVMVKDINSGEGNSYPINLTAMGDVLYFCAEDAINGKELWRSDGTAEGTVMVADINPGASSSGPSNLTVVGNILYFTANDGESGDELWRSDGTALGTTMVADIFAGEEGSSPYQYGVIGNTLFFSADDGSHGYELWKSDGTDTGTLMVMDINPGPSNSYPVGATTMGDLLYFRASDDSNGFELWKSDGTAEGTAMVADLNPGNASSKPDNITLGEDLLYFTAMREDGDYGLWKSDGTVAGTVMINPITYTVTDSRIRNMRTIGNTLYFMLIHLNSNEELWKCEGTGDAVMLKDIFHYNDIYSDSGTAVIGDILFSSVNDGIHGTELWRTDGTTDGTVMVADIVSGADGLMPDSIVALGNVLYFSALGGSEIWKSDGTAEGTERVAVVNPGSSGSDPELLTPLGNALYFSADDEIHGRELWKTENTGGAIMVKDICPVGSLFQEPSSTPESLAVLGETLFFSATDSVNGRELWKSDGTSEGTVIGQDIHEGDSDSDPEELTAVGDILFFSADNGINGRELWKSNGADNSAVMVEDIYPGEEGSSPSHLTAVGTNLFFSTFDEADGVTLWKSDGTAEGTVVLDYDGLKEAELENSIVIGNNLFFSTFFSNEYQLWKSDMVETVLIEEGIPSYQTFGGGLGGYIRERLPIGAMNGVLYFMAHYPDGLLELWKSDGSVAGAVRFWSGGSGVCMAMTSMTVAGDFLYFITNDQNPNSGSGDVLWESDGTFDGTVMIKEFKDSGAYVAELVAVENTLFIISADENEYALWRMNGNGGLVMLETIPGGIDAKPTDCTALNNMLFFTVDDGVHGRELYRFVPDQSVVGTYISYVTEDTAEVGTEAVHYAGESIASRGFVWSTSPYPTLSDDKSANGSGPGVFTQTISGLEENTEYFIRPYLIVGSETIFGDQVSFVTDSAGETENPGEGNGGCFISDVL